MRTWLDSLLIDVAANSPLSRTSLLCVSAPLRETLAAANLCRPRMKTPGGCCGAFRKNSPGGVASFFREPTAVGSQGERQLSGESDQGRWVAITRPRETTRRA